MILSNNIQRSTEKNRFSNTEDLYCKNRKKTQKRIKKKVLFNKLLLSIVDNSDIVNSKKLINNNNKSKDSNNNSTKYKSNTKNLKNTKNANYKKGKNKVISKPLIYNRDDIVSYINNICDDNLKQASFKNIDNINETFIYKSTEESNNKDKTVKKDDKILYDNKAKDGIIRDLKSNYSCNINANSKKIDSLKDCKVNSISNTNNVNENNNTNDKNKGTYCHCIIF